MATASAFNPSNVEDAAVGQARDSFADTVPELISNPDVDTHVVGGAPAAGGSWPSTVVIVADNGYQVCTGTLVDDDVVITAAHCVVGINVTHVITGSVNVANNGNWIPVSQAHAHHTYSSNGGSDIAVLELAYASPDPSIVIASGCASDQYVYDGANVAIVGFGAISYDGEQGTTRMHEAFSTIGDHDCSEDYVNGQYTTCDPSLRAQQKELFAGGNGIDACFGDSGGPLYVQGQYGEWYVTGVTARGASDNYGNACGGGGVWVRPDAHLTWIEGRIGKTLPRPTCAPPPVEEPEVPEELPEDELPEFGPPPTAEGAGWKVIGNTLVLKKDTLGALQLEIEANDPTTLTFEVIGDGILGSAETQEDGLVLYRPFKGAVGVDQIDVLVTDANGDSAELAIGVEIVGGLGCSTTGGASGLLGLFGLGLLGLRRR